MATQSSTNQLFKSQTLIRCFRVAELKELLKSLNLSTTGRKKDLLERVEQMIQLDTPHVHRKVQDIYDKNFSLKSERYSTPKTPPKPPLTCTSSVAPPPTFHVKFPDVNIKPHPFYQLVDTIMRPTYLVSQTDRHYKGKMMVLQFHLTPQQIQQIFISETTPGNYQTQVILRLCRRETSCEQEDFCPTKCHLKINKNICPIPGYNPELSCKPDYKYQMKPLNITSYVHTSPALANTIAISWQEDMLYPQGFCISIQLSRALSSSELLQSLKGRGIKSAEMSKALVKEKLAIGRDDEISSTSLRVSLICPLGKMKMSFPSRSVSCSHLQCFDAAIYLQLNEKKARWVCPVCDKKAPFIDLIIDGLMMDICNKTVSSDTEIEFLPDASWKVVNKSESKVTYSLMSNSPVLITDSPSQQQGSSSSQPIIIDLTCDSDDSDNTAPQNQPISLRPSSISTALAPSLPHKEEPSSPSLLLDPSTTTTSSMFLQTHLNRLTPPLPPLPPLPPPPPLPPSRSLLHLNSRLFERTNNAFHNDKSYNTTTNHHSSSHSNTTINSNPTNSSCILMPASSWQHRRPSPSSSTLSSLRSPSPPLYLPRQSVIQSPERWELTRVRKSRKHRRTSRHSTSNKRKHYTPIMYRHVLSDDSEESD